MTNLIIGIITTTIIVYILFGLILYAFQDNLIYFPTKQDFNSCTGFADAQKIITNTTRIYYKQNSDKIIIFYHGNAGSACDRSFIKNKFEKLNYSYAFVEYTGYSNNQTRPSTSKILKDVKNTNNFIKTKNFSQTIIMGTSIGSAFASYHSTLTKADKLILIAPFTSLSDVAKMHYGIYPIKSLLKTDLDNEKYLKNFAGEILIIHGEDDNIIPPKLSEKLQNTLNKQKTNRTLIKNAGHNDIYFKNQTWNEITNFLKK